MIIEKNDGTNITIDHYLLFEHLPTGRTNAKRVCVLAKDLNEIKGITPDGKELEPDVLQDALYQLIEIGWSVCITRPFGRILFFRAERVEDLVNTVKGFYKNGAFHGFYNFTGYARKTRELLEEKIVYDKRLLNEVNKYLNEVY